MYENKLYKGFEKKLTGLLVMIGGFFAKNIIILLYLLGLQTNVQPVILWWNQ